MKKSYRGFLAVFVVLGILAGCAGTATSVVQEQVAPAQTESAPATELEPEVSPDVVAQLNEQGAVTVIDVREESEYAGGHIPGAKLIPLDRLSDRLDEVPKDGTHVGLGAADLWGAQRDGPGYRNPLNPLAIFGAVAMTPWVALNDENAAKAARRATSPCSREIHFASGNAI